MSHGTTSGETGVSKISPSKMRTGEEKSVGKFLKFKVLEAPIDGIAGETKKIIGFLKEKYQNY
jgi:hypothetical protein